MVLTQYLNLHLSEVAAEEYWVSIYYWHYLSYVSLKWLGEDWWSEETDLASLYVQRENKSLEGK